MITIEKKLLLPDTYPLERIGKLDELLFFDIETTGFSPANTTLYLIGCARRKGNIICIDQFFADTPDEEPQLLAHFFRIVKTIPDTDHV